MRSSGSRLIRFTKGQGAKLLMDFYALLPDSVILYFQRSHDRLVCVVPCPWDTAPKRPLALFKKEYGSDPGGGFPIVIV